MAHSSGACSWISARRRSASSVGRPDQRPPELFVIEPDFESRVRASFDKQRFMSTIGATLERVAPGEVDIALPFDEAVTQQHGFVHAGALATVADSACGYAALSMMSSDAAVMSIEFKINMLAPA